MNSDDNEQTIVCQYCNLSTPEDLNFCANCDNQIKCLECGTKTFVGKTFCLKCSKPLIKIKAETLNTYRRTVKQDGKKYEEDTAFTVTDFAIKEIAPFVINQTMPSFKGVPPAKTVQSKQIRSLQQEIPYEEIKEESNEDVDLSDSQKNTPPNSQPTQVVHSQLTNFFTIDNDKLVAIEPDFKGSNWGNQQTNFLIVYCKAYKEIFKKPVPTKEIFKEAAQKLKIADPNNFTKYLNQTLTEFMTPLSDGFQLNTKGEKEFETILKLMQDSSSKPGFEYSDKITNGASKRPRLTKEEKDAIELWKDEINLGKLDIRDVKTGRDAALVALWIVTTKLKKKDALKWNETVHFLKFRYTTLAVSSDAFKKALESNEKLFQKNSNEEYFLSTDGQKLVEDWVSGKVSIKKEEK